MKRIAGVVLTLSLLATAVFIGGAGPIQQEVGYLLKASVMIRCLEGSGSGVVFRNGETDLVWTAAHVVCAHQQIKTAIDPRTGQPRVSISYQDVGVMQPMFENGRKVGDVLYLARIVRFSDSKEGGEDLALLRLYKKMAFPCGVTFLPAGKIPGAGDKLWHIGSMSGSEGSNTPTDGIFSVAGRLRVASKHNEVDNAKIYDQVTVSALCGCSGGGVFLKSSGECIGLLTEGLTGATETANCIVPARRIREYARRVHCEWAVDASIKVPESMEDEPPTDRDVPVPRDWPSLPAPVKK